MVTRAVSSVCRADQLAICVVSSLPIQIKETQCQQYTAYCSPRHTGRGHIACLVQNTSDQVGSTAELDYKCIMFRCGSPACYVLAQGGRAAEYRAPIPSERSPAKTLTKNPPTTASKSMCSTIASIFPTAKNWPGEHGNTNQARYPKIISNNNNNYENNRKKNGKRSTRRMYHDDNHSNNSNNNNYDKISMPVIINNYNNNMIRVTILEITTLSGTE